MGQRIVTDTDDRVWTCTPQASAGAAGTEKGRDVILSCTTETVNAPVKVTVGWQWEKIADNGLARMIALASPLSRR